MTQCVLCTGRWDWRKKLDKISYQTNGLASLHEIWGDFIVYRNLIPADTRLPSIAELQKPLGLERNITPRKAEPEYGRVVAEMLSRARELDLPGTAIRRLIYIGDTQLNDLAAFRNLCAAGQWPGWVFVGQDKRHRPPQTSVQGTLFQANRWSALPDFICFLKSKGFEIDKETAMVIDVDKTAIGARGRNDGAIDQARIEGVKTTVAELLGPRFDEEAFRTAYNELNQPAYHTFTADNQDYLAYLCLMLGAGLFDLDDLICKVKAGVLQRFIDLLCRVENRRAALAETGLTSIHDEVWRRVQARDPTPFKTFRYNEYLTTAARFGDLPGEPIDQVLAQRIVITQEVKDVALASRERGALIFGVSDKPDQASVPNHAQFQRGMRSLHCLKTLAVSEV